MSQLTPVLPCLTVASLVFGVSWGCSQKASDPGASGDPSTMGTGVSTSMGGTTSVSVGMGGVGTGTGTATTSTLGPSECAAGQMLCGTTCATLASDSANCGSCGSVCPAGRACVGGSCGCPAGTQDCDRDGVCSDATTDVANCGSCDNACGAAQGCSNGVCSCPGGSLDCAGSCVDGSTDRNHCGACNNACLVGSLCQSGSCQCADGQTDCSDGCVDLTSSGANCGACGNACQGTDVCAGGTCSSEGCGALTQCDQDCVDTNTSDTNCGTCGNDCTALGKECSGGSCVCPGNLTDCDGGCVNTQGTDPNNCGDCGTTCQSGQQCNAGSCGCPDGTETCNGSCVDTQANNSQHCGGCGVTCSGDRVCNEGSCGCPSGETDCNDSGDCRDLDTDGSHCGACYQQCQGGSSCMDGECICPNDGTLCNGNQCVDTDTNSNHCGSCNNNCATGNCSDGVCGGTTGSGGSGNTSATNDTSNTSSGGNECPTSWGEQNNGSITYYYFNQGTGDNVACNFGIAQRSPDVVNHVRTGNGQYFGAMNQPDYDTAAACGACVEVTRVDTGAKVVITIVDLCPTQGNDKCVSGHIDLSQAAFEQLGELSIGYMGSRAGNGTQINWRYVPCPTSGDITVRLKENNANWNEIVVQDHRYPIESVEVRVNGSWQQASRKEYNFWEPPGGNMGEYAVRVTDIHGNTVQGQMSTSTSNLGDQTLGGQFCE